MFSTFILYLDREPDIDRRDVKNPNNPDTPFYMDEEEPDPDKETSEERRI